MGEFCEEVGLENDESWEELGEDLSDFGGGLGGGVGSGYLTRITLDKHFTFN